MMGTNDIPAESLMPLWAKLSRGTTAPQGYHPLICHLIDVGAVAQVMWETTISSWTRRRIARALELPEETAGAWIGFLAATHDIGKACPPFQHRVETPDALRRMLVAAGLKESLNPPLGKVSHGAVSERTLMEDLPTMFAIPERVAWTIATSVGNHHGRFHGPSVAEGLGTGTLGKRAWTRARHALLQTLVALFDASRDTPPRDIDNGAAMWLAGLVSAADWIGSNTDYYHFAVPDLQELGGMAPSLDVHAYVHDARQTARRALRDLGWGGWTAATSQLSILSFHDLFPDATPPAPVQERVVELVSRPESNRGSAGPTLAIVEAPMGEGKTEAALYLVDYWSAARGQAGCYVALPSQATSNQMFGRVRAFLNRRYEDATVTLQLLHGHASLSAEFKLLLGRGERPFIPSYIDDDGDQGQGDGPPAVVAAEWFTHKKRGLLAPFGVGTVDQALMAALASKHVFVRLFGLAGKTVLIDEVHAYDTYMSYLLERLLAWLGALGCSVVLLSATLPARRRDSLTAAFVEGACGVPHPGPHQEPASYPRVTWVDTTVGATGAAATTHDYHVPASERSSKSLRLVHVDGALPAVPGEPFALGARLRAALADGGCAAAICNTVRRAQEVYQALRHYFPDIADDGAPELALLHARLPFEDREAREREALLRFGKDGAQVDTGGAPASVRRPNRAVLVSTQIIEQSLDLDFDLMVTDLAPIDLMLQRSGRLHRHIRPRPPGLDTPALWLCTPPIGNDDLPCFALRSTSIVYDNHVLLRSWLLVRDRDRIAVPDDVEALIEEVYGDEQSCPTHLPSTWQYAWEATQRRMCTVIESDSYEGSARAIKRPGDELPLNELTGPLRREDAPELHPANQAVTRLALPSIGLVCLYGTPERPSLDREGRDAINTRRIPDMALTERLLRRSLTVTHRGIVRALGDATATHVKPYMPAGWGTSALLRNDRMIVFDKEGLGMAGDIPLRLDPVLGLLIDATDSGSGERVDMEEVS